MRTKVEDRRSHIFIIIAFLFLLALYMIKFSFPQHTIQSAVIKHTSNPQETVPNNAVPSRLTSVSPVQSKPTAQPFKGPYNGTIVDKVAVIIEDRPRKNLVALILHFSSILGPSWPIIIYTSSENIGIFSSSAALVRHQQSGIITIRTLPSTVLFTNSDSVSSFLTKPWIYENLAPATHVLMFQSDSMLCGNAARSVEDFFEYDFVGAPIAPHLGVGMNGGLSLRKRESFLRIVNEWDWETDKGSRFEDRWFFDRFMDLLARETENDGPPEGLDSIKLPTMEVARTFSVETIDFPHPLGVHQVHRWLGEQTSLDEWCPEYKLCSGEYIVDN